MDRIVPFMKKLRLSRFTPFLGLGLFLLSAWVLYLQLHRYRWHDILSRIHTIPNDQVFMAAALTVLSYFIMTGYDLLAMRYIRHPLPYGKTALAASLGYAFSNNIGFSMLAGASVRYSIYSSWGLSAVEITQVVIFCSLSLWLGFFGLSGLVFITEPLTLPQSLHLPFSSTQPLGLFLLLVTVAYFVLTLFIRKSVVIRGWTLAFPSWRLAGGQICLAALDWLLAAAVLYSLLPETTPIPFGYFLEIYLLAQLGGLLSQVPGGLGIFESLILLLAPPAIPASALIGALIVYRVIYYFFPLLLATVVLGGEELLRRRPFFTHAKSFIGHALERVFIPLLSLVVFVAGAILLFSGALPAVSDRVAILDEFIPLPLLEFSHFIGSLAGMGLLLIARGLQRRLDAAYLLTLGLLGFGVAASLLKGLDYEEALILTIVFLVLLPSRRLFFRRASLFSERFTPGWLAAIGMVLAATLWLGFFAFRHVEYAHDLWWHFSIKGDAPRFMRAGVGAVCLALAFALARLLRPAPPKSVPVDEQQMATIRSIVRQSDNASSHLALLSDKRFWISANQNAFIMYGVSGQTWVSMGDPIGPEEEWPELIWQFHRQAHRYADRAVFYEVGHEHLHLYLDLGLSALKLGEEAWVPLTEFSLEGAGRKDLRYIQRKMTKLGCQFEIIPPEGVATVLDTLRSVSDEWLSEKNTREKEFSLGFFDPIYLQQTPVAVVRIDRQIIAFANIWQSADQEELTLDLMRHRHDAPNGVMEFLFIEMMRWGRQQGYRWFNLGMAPLTGMETRDPAPLWHKISHWVSQYGGHFYNFQGLRLYKEKFNPVWTPRYLACPAGLTLPLILADIGALVSGGYKGIIFK